MVQGSKDFRLALKSSEPLGVGRDNSGENLDRHLTFQVGIGGPIHLAHAAHPDLGNDLIGAEAGAGGESHGQVAAIIGDAVARADT